MSTPITSIAQFKREVATSPVLVFENLSIPELSGEREVIKVQTQRLCTRPPKGHPKYDELKERGSWLTFPKRDEITFEGRTAVLSKDGQIWCRITVPE